MDFQALIIKISKILENLKIPYAITGGYAVSVWGRPRSTFDIDVVIELFAPKVRLLTSALRKISELSYLDERAAERAVEQKGEFNFIHTESGIKVDFWVAGKEENSQRELNRRIPKVIDGHRIYFLSPEDLILNKLRWHKESESSRQLEDIESILKIQKKIDYKYLKKWAKKQSTFKILESLM